MEYPEVLEFKDNIVKRWFKRQDFNKREWFVGSWDTYLNFVMEVNQYIHPTNYKKSLSR